MSTSLLAVVQNTPNIEPLPAYRRDPETSSIRSSAPSYVSEAPTYHSTLPASSSSTERTGLPPASYAPGWIPSRYDRNGLSHLDFSISQWSSIYSSPQARHYHNVAARRTNLAMIDEQALISTLTNTFVFPTTVPVAAQETVPATTSVVAGSTINSPLERSSMSASVLDAHSPAAPEPPILSIDAYSASSPAAPAPHLAETTSTTPRSTSPLPTRSTATLPLSPHEDPDLVGHAAASVARERRLYIATEMRSRRQQQEERDAAALREESRRWDFLLGQMADWEAREGSWVEFSRKMQTASGRRGGGSSAKRTLFRFWK